MLLLSKKDTANQFSNGAESSLDRLTRDKRVQEASTQPKPKKINFNLKPKYKKLIKFNFVFLFICADRPQ